MNDSISRRQHFVPRFYLRQFAMQKKNNFYIWCYDKLNDNIFNSTVQNICVGNWFYDEKFQKDPVFEKLLSILDGYFSNLYKIIREKPMNALKQEEKQFFAELVLLQDTRTPKTRDEFIIVNKKITNSEEIQEMKRIAQLFEMFNIESEDIKPTFSERLDRIMEFDLFLLKNEIPTTGAGFYTSDHPICHYSVSEEKDMKVLFPITPELCLMFTNDKEWESIHPSHYGRINQKFVQVVNERIVEKSYRFIFSRNNDFAFVKRILKI